jgi:nucleotide-binding universal stress UspA family protein
MVELRRILVGVDFGVASMAAAQWTARHLGTDAELVLAHVVDLPRMPVFLHGLLPDTEELETNARARAEPRLRELARVTGAPRVWSELRFGAPADTLSELAREYEADLIVVGEHGRPGGSAPAVGSTTERLVRIAPAPVLVARELTDLPPRALLASLDATPSAARILGWSRLFQQRFDASVTACYAVDLVRAYGRVRTVSAATRAADLESDIRTQAATWIGERLRDAGFAPDGAEIRVLFGDPRAVIPGAAERAGADLVIMASRETGALGRVVLGSVAGAVLNGSRQSVLIVVGRQS